MGPHHQRPSLDQITAVAGDVNGMDSDKLAADDMNEEVLAKAERSRSSMTEQATDQRVALEWHAAWDPHSGLGLPGTSLQYQKERAHTHRMRGHLHTSSAVDREP